MALIRSSNPALNRINKAQENTYVDEANRASYSGIARKSGFFIALTFLSALTAFFLPVMLGVTEESLTTVFVLLIVCLIIAFITGIIAALAPGTTKITGTIYALTEGFVVGIVSLLYYIVSVLEGGGGGEVFAALFATIGVAAGMIVLYSTGVIRVGSGFRKFMISALVGLIIVSIIMFIASLASPTLSVIFYGSGPFSIMLSVIMVIFASLMILLDLNRMTQIVENGMDKKYEWYAAFGLLLTLVWLYLEFLKLFMKLSRYFKK